MRVTIKHGNTTLGIVFTIRTENIVKKKNVRIISQLQYTVTD